MRSIGVPFLSRDGCNIDDPAIPIRKHPRHQGPAAKVDPEEVDLQDFLPLIRRAFPELLAAPCDPRIVNENIDRIYRLYI